MKDHIYFDTQRDLVKMIQQTMYLIDQKHHAFFASSMTIATMKSFYCSSSDPENNIFRKDILSSDESEEDQLTGNAVFNHYVHLNYFSRGMNRLRESHIFSRFINNGHISSIIYAMNHADQKHQLMQSYICSDDCTFGHDLDVKAIATSYFTSFLQLTVAMNFVAFLTLSFECLLLYE